MEVSGQLDASVALPRVKTPLYPLDRRLDDPQSQSGRRNEKNAFSFRGIEHQPPNPMPVTILSYRTGTNTEEIAVASFNVIFLGVLEHPRKMGIIPRDLPPAK
jgi:hypothetical protein